MWVMGEPVFQGDRVAQPGCLEIARGQRDQVRDALPGEKQPRDLLQTAVAWRGLLALCCLAFLVRTGAVLYLRSYDGPMDWENGAIARSIASGYGFSFDYSEGYINGYYPWTRKPVPTSFQAPFYPYLLSGFYWLGARIGTSVSFALLHLLQSLVGAATVLTLYLLGRRLFGPRIAWLAALVLALYPASIFVATVSHQTIWVVWFLALTVLAFLQLLEAPSFRSALRLGAMSGVTILTEPVVTAWLLAAAVWAWLRNREARLGRGLLTALGVAALLLLPWQVRNQLVHKRFVFIKSSGPFVLWQGNNSAATGTVYLDWQGHRFPASPPLKAELSSIPNEIDRDRIWMREVWSAVRHRPGHALGLVGRKLLYYWTYAPYSNTWSRHIAYWLPYLLLLPVAAYGLASSRGAHPRLPLLYLLFLSFSVVYAIAYAGPRYRIPLEPYLMLFASYALLSGRRAISSRGPFACEGRALVGQITHASRAASEGRGRSVDERAPWLSLVIPAFNEESRVPATLAAVDAYFRGQAYATEILVVDDGSTDGTVRAALEQVRSMLVPVRVLSYTSNRGKGHAVRYGVERARGDYIFFSDADLSTPIEELEKLLPALERGAEVAIASRALPGSVLEMRQPWHREMLGRCFNLMVRLLAVSGIRDTQCGFKGFTRESAKLLFSRQRFDGFAFDVELLFLARRLELPVVEVPVRWRDSRETKVHAGRDGLRMLASLLRLRLNELAGVYGGETGPAAQGSARAV